MKDLKSYEFWFITGSQHLYGEDTLKQVAAHAQTMAASFDADAAIPCTVVYKGVVTTSAEIERVIKEANYSDHCAGIITWMHTFSPSKMWIAGLTKLQKPYMHLHTQFNQRIPNEEIDMDFMNLNQSAHGDREHGFIGARLRLARKIVVGYWENRAVRGKIASWMRTAVGVAVSRSLRMARFGDNMRDVAVTEGDKVEAEIQLGWSVNTYGVGDLTAALNAVADSEIDALVDEYRRLYELKTDNIESVRYQARLEIAMRRFLEKGGFGAFTTTFEDLHGLEQLPGLACQRLMADGYGFGGEGDWKISAMTHIMKAMSAGLEGGCSFMEDYTYDLADENELILGAHMLEVCPTIAQDKPSLEVHPLGIGGKNPPARLVFEGRAGSAICASLIDMGGRMRLIVNEVEAVKPILPMPNLPVARVMWKPLPDLATAAEAWILAGGAHHTVMSYALTSEQMRDFAQILGIEFVLINQDTNIDTLSRDLMLADLAWKLQ